MENLLWKTIQFFEGDAKRIQHFIKVYEFARLIGLGEGLDEETQHILESAAIVHDVGIRIAEETVGYSNGALQEKLGPDAARKILSELSYSEQSIQRICFLVGHHHTYTNMDGLDYGILVEADFLVNLFEDQASESACKTAYERIFHTKTGKQLFETMFHME